MGINSDDHTTFASADVRNVVFDAPPTEQDIAAIKADLAAIPDGEKLEQANRRLAPLLSGTMQAVTQLHFAASGQEKLLVSSRDDPIFSAHRDWLTEVNDEVWRSALAIRLAADLLREDPAATASVARRVMNYMGQREYCIGVAIASRLLAEANVNPPRLTLDPSTHARLSRALDQPEPSCAAQPGGR